MNILFDKKSASLILALFVFLFLPVPCNSMRASDLHRQPENSPNKCDTQLHQAILKSSSLAILHLKDYTDPFSNDLVKERFADVSRILNENVQHCKTQYTGDELGSHVASAINSAVFTFSTDAAYILDSPNRDLSRQKKQYSAYLSLANSQFEKSLHLLGIPEPQAANARNAFQRSTDIALDYFDRPRVAMLDGLRSQQELASDLLLYQSKIESKTDDFETMLQSFVYDDPEMSHLNDEGYKVISELMATHFAASAILHFAGKNKAFADHDSPINKIDICHFQSAGAGTSGLLSFDYVPNDKFDSMRYLNEIWAKPSQIPGPTD